MRILAVSSGKGGVGKSSVTVNLAAALTELGHSVGVLDADIHGFSVPRLLGLVGEHAPQVEKVAGRISAPEAHGIRAISIGMFLQKDEPVAWRGPMLHRTVEQFLTEVDFGDPEFLLIDLPPGTGDILISLAQLLTEAEILSVTTGQIAAADVAWRSAKVLTKYGSTVIGVIDNMSSGLVSGTHVDLFGSGGAEAMQEKLEAELDYPVPLLTKIPLDLAIRESGDAGIPVTTFAPDSPAAQAFLSLANQVTAAKN